MTEEAAWRQCHVPWLLSGQGDDATGEDDTASPVVAVRRVPRRWLTVSLLFCGQRWELTFPPDYQAVLAIGRTALAAHRAQRLAMALGASQARCRQLLETELERVGSDHVALLADGEQFAAGPPSPAADPVGAGVVSRRTDDHDGRGRRCADGTGVLCGGITRTAPPRRGARALRPCAPRRHLDDVSIRPG